MSDLSRLLDDVYGDRAADAPAATPEVPEEQHGQQDWSAGGAFADWVTDPPPSGPDEHEPGGTEPVPATTSPRSVPRSSFTDLAEEPAVAPAPAPQATAGWHRDDDDILPTGRRRRSIRSRSTSPAAPSTSSTGPVAAADLPEADVAAGAAQPPEPTSRRFRLRRG